MADAEHLKKLRLGVESWNNWRDKSPNIIPKLNKAKLDFGELCQANLSYADLEDAELGEADLDEANLIHANLNRAALYRAKMRCTNLSDAYLGEAYLVGADMHGANLSNADLSGANLGGAFMADTIFKNATLNSTLLTECELEGADFSGCHLNRTIFGLTDLTYCKGLESVEVSGPCVIDFPTLRASKNLPKVFLTKLGIPDSLMENLPKFYHPTRSYPAFLSHSSADEVFVRKLYEDLIKKGLTVYWAQKKMKPGDNIHDRIGEAIDHYDKFILVCSENALNSWWVEKELERVFEKEREMQKERGKKFRLVIPIMIDDTILTWKDGAAATVRSSEIGDFTQWQDEAEFEKALKELVDALNADRLDIKPPSFL